MNSPKITLAVLTAASMGACAWWMAGRPKAIERDQIIFSHALHVEQNGMDCAQCHAGVTEATDLAQSYLPKEASCLECHEPAEDFADVSAAEIEESLKKIVGGAMKHKEKLTLSEADIADIAAYMAGAK